MRRPPGIPNDENRQYETGETDVVMKRQGKIGQG